MTHEEESTGAPFPKRWKTALYEYYENHGLTGRKTVKRKKEFWDKMQPNTHIYHVETDKMWVKVMEYGWIVDKFPEEMTYA